MPSTRRMTAKSGPPGPDEGKAGRYLLLPPDFDGPLTYCRATSRTGPARMVDIAKVR